jgi:hypothetical protein
MKIDFHQKILTSARTCVTPTGFERITTIVFRNFGLFNFAGTFPELTENLGVSSAELTNRDSRSSLPDPTRWPNCKQYAVDLT